MNLELERHELVFPAALTLLLKFHSVAYWLHAQCQIALSFELNFLSDCISFLWLCNKLPHICEVKQQKFILGGNEYSPSKLTILKLELLTLMKSD